MKELAELNVKAYVYLRTMIIKHRIQVLFDMYVVYSDKL